MELVEYFYIALSVVPVIVSVIGVVVLRVLQRREFGSFFADARAYVRTVRLPITHREADGLCHRGLRAVAGHSESERRGADRFECDGLEFRLVERSGETAITIKGYASGDGALQSARPRDVRAGRERVDRVADWIASAPLDGPLAEDHPSYRQFGVF